MFYLASYYSIVAALLLLFFGSIYRYDIIRYCLNSDKKGLPRSGYIELKGDVCLIWLRNISSLLEFSLLYSIIIKVIRNPLGIRYIDPYCMYQKCFKVIKTLSYYDNYIRTYINKGFIVFILLKYTEYLPILLLIWIGVIVIQKRNRYLKLSIIP